MSYDEATGAVVFASRPEAVVYDYRTGHADEAGTETLMDVALVAAGSDAQYGGRSSGCDTGFGGLILLAAAFLLKRKQ